jgi:hypothetical protein
VSREKWICILGSTLLVWTLAGGCSGQNDRGATNVSLSEQEDHAIDAQPVISFDTLAHDFGTILEGERVLCFFDYENTGEGPLVIQSVEASCGCTIVDWSGDPVAPGASERLQVVFDASGRSGAQVKLITIISNAINPRVQLILRANVKTNV